MGHFSLHGAADFTVRASIANGLGTAGRWAPGEACRRRPCDGRGGRAERESVPLLGFGNTLWQGVKEAVDENGFIGIFMGGFKASAVGISAALIFGYIASFIFDPKMKK